MAEGGIGIGNETEEDEISQVTIYAGGDVQVIF